MPEPQIKPLTLTEVLAYKPPASLAGWKLVPDANGVCSYRAEIGDLSYIAIPKPWVGRSLEAPKMGETNYGLNLQDLQHNLGESITTNSGTFRPSGAEGVPLNGTAGTTVAPGPVAAACPVPASYEQYLLPAAIVVGAALFCFKRKA